MITLTAQGVFLTNQWDVVTKGGQVGRETGIARTMTWQILKEHNHGEDMEELRLTFDALVSPDNNYVNILQTARAGGLEQFPVPYVLSNCHHTLCAVGGTINEDDHVYGLGAAKKYGGIFVPPYRAVLHQYMREQMAGCGSMILGSDSHTRYGVLGTLGIGEGGGEVVKQLLGRTYDLKRPPVIAIKLTGTPKPGVGPHDVALVLIGATFSNGFLKNRILEFVGSGIHGLSVEYRMGIDVMTTESGALSSIWCTDDSVSGYLSMHGRADAYREMRPGDCAYYDGLVEIDLSQVECMLAMPFHPSRAVSIREFKNRLSEFLQEIEAEGCQIKGRKGRPFSVMSHVKDGELLIDQALVSGCSGGMFENIVAVADILEGYAVNADGPSLGIHPASLPVMTELMRQGIAGKLSAAGATLRPAVCGPCFGVTDVPADNQLSIRHCTRNYPNREGSRPGDGQMAAVFLMDARSIAATIKNGGRLTAATELNVAYQKAEYRYDETIYKNQVFDGFNKPEPQAELVMGPNIADWPRIYPIPDHLLLKVTGVYAGSVTTDELIPSGEASSYRSNPEKISEYMMISRDKDYVKRAKSIRSLETERRETNGISGDEVLARQLKQLCKREGCNPEDIMIGGLMAGETIGDGSSREQAASCQKILGGIANLANTYATKRYRSNLINWGILPLLTEETMTITEGELLFIRNIKEVLTSGRETVVLERLTKEGVFMNCFLGAMTEEERQILLAGCLMNHYNR